MPKQKTKNKQQAKNGLVAFTDIGWDDYISWQEQDPKILAKINDLIDACKQNPFKGLGKPEPLVENLTGYWSRRITHEHRLVYLPEDGNIYIISCRYHY